MLEVSTRYTSPKISYVTFTAENCPIELFFTITYRGKDGYSVTVKSETPFVDSFEFVMSENNEKTIQKEIEKILREKYDIDGIECFPAPWIESIKNIPGEISEFISISKKSKYFVRFMRKKKESIFMYNGKIIEGNMNEVLSKISAKINTFRGKLEIGPLVNIEFDKTAFFKKYLMENFDCNSFIVSMKEKTDFGTMYIGYRFGDILFTGMEMNGMMYGEAATKYGLFFFNGVAMKDVLHGIINTISENKKSVIPIRILPEKIIDDVYVIAFFDSEGDFSHVYYGVVKDGMVYSYNALFEMKPEEISVLNEFSIV